VAIRYAICDVNVVLRMVICVAVCELYRLHLIMHRPVHTVAEKCDSLFSATLALFCDSVDRALRAIFDYRVTDYQTNTLSDYRRNRLGLGFGFALEV